jgi:hypothetical protein
MRVLAEPISGLDERFVSSALAERSFHNASAVRVAGNGVLRLADGAPDMNRIAAEIDGWSRRLPRLRHRLQHAPAGLMAPAWVPDASFSITAHLRSHPGVLEESDISAEILHGDANGELDMGRSPWNVLVVDLAEGDLLLVIKMHHVFGDGLSGVSTLDVLLTDASGDRPPLPPAPEVRAPANAPELFIAAWRNFCSSHPTWAGRRSAAAAKPPLVRLRKVIGRNLRGIRSRSSGGQEQTPARQYGVTSVELKTARRTARVLGGSLTDLMVAAAAYGVARGVPPGHSSAVTIAVPVSERRSGDSGMNNQVRIVPVTLVPDGDRAGTVASVHAQSTAGISAGHSVHLSRDTWDAMATFLPAGFRPRYFAGQPVKNILFWTSLDPSERLGILASNYLDTLNITVVAAAAADFDMEAMLATLQTVLSGAEPFQAAAVTAPEDRGAWDAARENGI